MKLTRLRRRQGGRHAHDRVELPGFKGREVSITTWSTQVQRTLSCSQGIAQFDIQPHQLPLGIAALNGEMRGNGETDFTPRNRVITLVSSRDT